MKNVRAFGVLTLAFSVSLPALGAVVIPPDDQVIRTIQTGATRAALPREVRLLNWNIKKGEQGALLATDLPAFASGRNLVTLQEGYESDFIKGILASLPSFSFYMASAFVHRNLMTGVITGASFEPTRLGFRRSPGNEPILNSPKMTGLAYFELEGGGELLLANLHGLNFTDVKKFTAQIQDVMAVIAAHQGPSLLAGDFNTWADPRMKVLLEEAAKAGLEKVHFERSGRGQNPNLDHVFQKGCVVTKAWVVESVKSSDHDPLFVDLSCGTP